ncbi:hypothetical protein D3C87_1704380 [compost metagenome]
MKDHLVAIVIKIQKFFNFIDILNSVFGNFVFVLLQARDFFFDRSNDFGFAHSTAILQETGDFVFFNTELWRKNLQQSLMTATNFGFIEFQFHFCQRRDGLANLLFRKEAQNTSALVNTTGRGSFGHRKTHQSHKDQSD